MKINKIALKNYRCFEEIEVGFHDKLTVIVGNNGAGKTSVLEGVAVFLGTMFTGLDALAGMSISKKDAHLKVYQMGESEDIQAQYPVEILAEGIVDGEEIVWKRTLNGESGNTTIKDAKPMLDVAKSYQERLRTGDRNLILPVIAYYGTGRLWDYHREKKSDIFKENSKTNGYIDSLDGTANIRLICFECITGYEDIKLLYNLDKNDIDCYYKDGEGDKMKIPLSQMSDGYKNIISLIADIAYRMAILNPQLGTDILQKTDGVILIDEVDLHLHPAWQHRILSDLREIFPEVQFIVTTHAPAVISSAKSENLVILKKNEVMDAQAEIYGNDINSILTDVMDVMDRNPAVAELFEQFYVLLNDRQFDGAEKVLDEIDEQRDYHDKEVAACRVKLKLERIRGGQK